MTVPSIVEHLNVIDDILSGDRFAEILHPKDLLNLEIAEEALYHSIVLAVAFSARTGQYPMILEQFLKIMAAILTAPIRVGDETMRGLASPDCNGRRIHYRTSAHTFAHEPTHDSARIEVNNNSQVQPTPPRTSR